jgi:hypothetical protein
MPDRINVVSHSFRTGVFIQFTPPRPIWYLFSGNNLLGETHEGDHDGRDLPGFRR